MKGGDSMQRTILVTRIRNRATKEEKEIYGRYDAVSINKDHDIIGAYKALFEMSDSDFAKYGKFKKKII